MKICLLALAGIATLFATPADAASRSVWVSRNGSNISGCGTVSKPCATFQFAHDNALAATGVINVLDSGDYGPITITKPMSILNTGGAMAVIAASSGESAVTINAPADAAIVLRGLTLVGGDRGRHGIVFNTGVSLAVSDCVIERFRTNGLYVRPNGSGTVHLSLARLRVADNGVVGILIEPRQTVAVHGAIADVEATHNGSRGIFVSGEARRHSCPGNERETLKRTATSRKAREASESKAFASVCRLLPLSRHVALRPLIVAFGLKWTLVRLSPRDDLWVHALAEAARNTTPRAWLVLGRHSSYSPERPGTDRPSGAGQTIGRHGAEPSKPRF
jgi:hypothetical protein